MTLKGGENMSKYRPMPIKSKYYLPKEDYLTAIHYALRYPMMLAELDDARDTSTAIRYDKDKVQTSPSDDMIMNAAVRASELSEKVKLIEDIISVCSNGLDSYLKWGVCYGLTFDQLEAKGMPLGRTAYYEMRRKFYFILSRKI